MPSFSKADFIDFNVALERLTGMTFVLFEMRPLLEMLSLRMGFFLWMSIIFFAVFIAFDFELLREELAFGIRAFLMQSPTIFLFETE